MRIVVVDGYTLNPGDLSWAALEALGDCTVHDRTPPERAVERCGGAEIVLTNKVAFGEAVLAALPDLRYVGVLATGYNIVDAAAAARRGVVVTNVPAYSTDSVAQLVFAHLLELAHHVGGHSEGVRGGKWSRCADFAYWDWPLVELAGLTMGVVGFGRIGRAVARLARAFGMEVLACDVRGDLPGAESVRLVPMDELFARGDVVSLHCPLTPRTRGLVSAERLATMKPTAFLINTARGPLVDERALADALNAGRLAGAGLDVLSSEPPAADNPLLSARNCCITPHVAWATRSARRRLMAEAVENVRAFLAGWKRNVVS